jgi:serine-type D-Ala-D-Ala carboxypeptidase/endopeptidase (penicillin-binding protein 4)
MRAAYLNTAGLTLLALAASTRGESLEAKINSLLASPLVKGASISLDVQEVTARAPVALYSHDATAPLSPASNCKILTTAAAFEKYGPAATFKTYLYQAGSDLVLVGGGDPGLGDAKLCASGETPTTVFETWVARLKQAGITQCRDLIVDDRVFDDQWVHPNWPADQRLDWYCAPVGGLNFNANCLDWTPKLTTQGVAVQLMPDTSYVSIVNKATKGSSTKVSALRPAKSNRFEINGTVAASGTTPYSVPIYDPGLWTGTILRDVLVRAGIQQTGQVRRAQAAERFTPATLVASHETPILAVIERANTNSLNMMAECICKRLGYDATAKPGTWASGTAAVEAYVVSLGAKPEWVSLDDGSGLSGKNHVAARAFTTVLAHVANRPDGNKFINTLAEPGDEGTLEKRFKGMSVASHVHAKTGHITGASTLSGYILTGKSTDSPSTARVFAFSILVNKYQGNVNPWQDQVCQAIYDWAIGK